LKLDDGFYMLGSKFQVDLCEWIDCNCNSLLDLVRLSLCYVDKL